MQRARSLTCISAVAALCLATPIATAANETNRYGWIDLETETAAASLALAAPAPADVDTADTADINTAEADTAPVSIAAIAAFAFETPEIIASDLDEATFVTAAIPTIAVEKEPIFDIVPYSNGRIVLSATDAIVGIASFYDDPQQTASGEQYDPNAFTAAAQLEIRHIFGGVRYGRLYQPAYGLGEYGGKKIIVRFNDVGPLRPGRKFDLSRAAMAYFDQSLDKGLLPNFRMIPLPLGRSYPLGPITDQELAHLGIDDDQAATVCDVEIEPQEVLYTAKIPAPKPAPVALSDQPKPRVAAAPVIAKPVTTRVAAKAAPARNAKTAAARTKPAPIRTAAATPSPKAADTAPPAVTPWIKRVWGWVSGS